MDYKYTIAAYKSEDRWIMIVSNDDFVFEKSDSLLCFMKRIQSDIGGEINKIGENKYSITGDPCNLTYQWDESLGLSVVYPSCVNRETVTAFLRKYMG